LERKLGTFRHCGQQAAEYQFFVPIQVKIVSVISCNRVFAEIQNEQIFSDERPHTTLPA
jgi:hypothetical protein